jgi:hypothetical protein
MAEIVAKRLVEHFERPGLVVMKRPRMTGRLRSQRPSVGLTVGPSKELFHKLVI